MFNRNIILIGMPAAGKSTVGVLLAKTTGMIFVDTDLIIQQREKRLLQDIINNDGLDGFLLAEEATILNMDFFNACHVVATGGSVIYSDSAMKRLSENGMMVYLRLSFDEICKRINNITTRGIAMGKEQTLKGLYDERIPLYEKYADMTVDCNGKSVETTIDEIIYRLKNFK